MRRVLPIAAVLACLLPAAPAAAAPTSSSRCRTTPSCSTAVYGDDQLAFDRAVEMGATWVRVNVRWAASMPDAQARAKHKPRTVAWDFSRLSRLLDETEARG